MKIRAKNLGPNASINGIPLKRGEHSYKTIDSKDPLTALQLNALREIGLIDFDDTLDPQLLADTEKALNESRLEIDADLKLRPDGLPLSQKYKSSKIKEVPRVRKPAKSSQKARRDNDNDKS